MPFSATRFRYIVFVVTVFALAGCGLRQQYHQPVNEIRAQAIGGSACFVVVDGEGNPFASGAANPDSYTGSGDGGNDTRVATVSTPPSKVATYGSTVLGDADAYSVRFYTCPRGFGNNVSGFFSFGKQDNSAQIQARKMIDEQHLICEVDLAVDGNGVPRYNLPMLVRYSYHDELRTGLIGGKTLKDVDAVKWSSSISGGARVAFHYIVVVEDDGSLEYYPWLRLNLLSVFSDLHSSAAAEHWTDPDYMVDCTRTTQQLGYVMFSDLKWPQASE